MYAPISLSPLHALTRPCFVWNSLIPQQPGFGTLNPSEIAPQVLMPVKMLNGRKLLEKGESPSFDQHSFMFAEQPLAFRGDWESIGEVRDHYLPEVEALVRAQVPGADHVSTPPHSLVHGLVTCSSDCCGWLQPDAKVLIFDHTIRTHANRGRLDEKAQNSEHGWGGYANSAHTDATVRVYT